MEFQINEDVENIGEFIQVASGEFDGDQVDVEFPGLRKPLFNQTINNSMSGSGFLDTLQSLTTGNQERILRAGINLLPDRDETAAPGFVGERHQILFKDGKLTQPMIANYSGPFTKTMKRLKRGDKGRTGVDKAAKRHDIDYLLAKNAQNITSADMRFLKKLDSLEKSGGDSKLNIIPARAGIKTKQWLENKRLLSRDKFGKLTGITDEEDLKFVQKQLEDLQLQGFGLPGARLKIKSKLKGSGAISNFIINSVYPKILAQIGLPSDIIKKGVVKQVVDLVIVNAKKGLKKLSVPKLSKDLALVLTPLLIHAHQIGLSGSGTGSTNVKQIEKENKKLVKEMAKGIKVSLMSFGKKDVLLGSGIFGSIGKLFKKVVNSDATAVAVAVGSAVLGPEIGVGGAVAKFVINKLVK